MLNAPQSASRADQTLSLNMKLLAHHELAGFGGLGEGMGMQLTSDGRRILCWRTNLPLKTSRVSM